MKAHRNPFLSALQVSSRTIPALISVAGLSSQTAYADATWVGDTSQDWNNAANWSSDPANPAGNFFVNTAAEGVYPIIGSTPPFTPVDILVGDGAGNTGRVQQNAGTVATGNGNWMFIGANGGTGTYNLAGDANVNAGAVNVGAWGAGGATGTFNVNTSGTLNATAGNARPFGFGDASILVGENGSNGTFELQNGTVNASFGATFGQGASAGVLNMSGGAMNITGELQMGRSGTGTATQTGGALSTTGYFVIAREQGSVSSYALSGGTVNAATAFGFTSIGSSRGATGTLSVSGTGAFTSNAGMILGEGWQQTGAANGTLDLSGAGQVTVGGGGIEMGRDAAAVGIINLNGGTLLTTRIFKGAGSGTINFDSGTLKATATSTTFLNGLTAANVKAGGAIIDSNGFDITVGQGLLDGTGGGGLVKNGAGRLTLDGANTYIGATNVNAGTLELNGSSTTSVLVANQATLTGSGTTTGTVTFAAGSTLSASTTAPLVASGFSFSGPTNLVFNGIPENGNQYVLFQYGAGGVTGLSNLSSTFRTVIADDPLNSQVVGTVTTATIAWNSTNGTWVNAGTGWTGGSTSYFNGDTVSFGERPAASTITLSGVLLPAAVTVSNTSNPYIFTGSGSISGATSLTKEGAGALTLATPNSYSGGTFLNGGQLNLNHASALGSGSLFLNGGTLNNSSGSPLVMTNNITQFWDADLTFTGSSSLDMGTGSVTIGGVDENRTLTVSSNTLAIGELGTSFQGVIKQGAGTLELASTGAGNDASVIRGVLNVAAGTIQMNRTGTNAATSGDLTAAGITGGGTITNGAAVERWLFTNPAADSHTFSGVLADGSTGKLGFNKSGAGTQVLTGANTYTGRTTVNQGILSIAQPLLSDTGELFIDANGVLDLPHGAIDQVGVLVINGVGKANGTYDATTDPGFITGTGKIRVGPASGYTTWASSFGLDPLTDGLASVDKELDGFLNGTEFILGGSPVSGGNNPKIYTLNADSSDADAQNELVMTIAVPVGTPAFSEGAPTSASSFAGFGITVRGSTTLGAFPVVVHPVDPVITGLPAAPVLGGITYEYRSFSLEGSDGLSGKGFLQVVITHP